MYVLLANLSLVLSCVLLTVHAKDEDNSFYTDEAERKHKSFDHCKQPGDFSLTFGGSIT